MGGKGKAVLRGSELSELLPHQQTQVVSILRSGQARGSLTLARDLCRPTIIQALTTLSSFSRWGDRSRQSPDVLRTQPNLHIPILSSTLNSD
jgi:hypothetical protein